MNSELDRFITYEEMLDRDPEWGLNQGGLHFEERSFVFLALTKLAGRLNRMAVPYAVIGDLAMFRHGFRKFTEIIEVLVDGVDIDSIHANLVGDGYVRPSIGGRSLRDPKLGVLIKFAFAGERRGGRKPRPLPLPHRSQINAVIGGVSYASLNTIIEMKLPTDIAEIVALRDVSDVQELIKILSLPFELGDLLNPEVRRQYRLLWEMSQGSDKPLEWQLWQ